MRAIGGIIESISDTDTTVLIRGESGVGKDLIARAVHRASTRRDGPFVKVNCAAIPQDLLESQLFGHEKGAFTGAHRRKFGQFEYANKGTLFLDEIAELPLALQAKLLHVLQDFRFSRVGGHGVIDVDARVIAATNRDLEAAMTRGLFREDLYYRLNVVEIRVPPLRERRDEIPALAVHFLAKFNAQYGRKKQLSPETIARLQEYPWSGNVRELENAVRRLVVLTDGEQAVEALVAPRRNSAIAEAARATISEGLRDIARRGAREAERKALGEVLDRVHWNRAEASRILKVSYKTLTADSFSKSRGRPDAGPRLMLGVALKTLTKRYGDLAAVEGLSLDVAPGELVSLLGPSGCGKTTTLRLVAGFLQPEAGEIWVGERCLSSPASVVPPERRRMAMIFQSYALWPHMTVAQNVAYGLRFKSGITRADRDRRVAEMLRVVQLAGYEPRYPGELSGGQQQRVAVARALVVEPEILLLDEPLSNLDANLREEMRFEIRRLHEAFGITTLYVTHDQAEAMVISDRVAVLNRGRVEQVGTAEDLFRRPRTRFVAEFIGRTNLIDAVTAEPGIAACGSLRLRLASRDAAIAAPIVVSIRPHEIELLTAGRTAPAGANVLAGTVQRTSYLGARRRRCASPPEIRSP